MTFAASGPSFILEFAVLLVFLTMAGIVRTRREHSLPKQEHA